MSGAKPVGTPLSVHLSYLRTRHPQLRKRDHISKVQYASVVGRLMYAMCTRPIISHTMGVVSRYMSNPGKQHWEAVKWILRYISGTVDIVLCFWTSSIGLHGHVDVDMTGDLANRKSITGWVCTYGGTAVSHLLKPQKIVELSTTEVEYVAMTEASK